MHLVRMPIILVETVFCHHYLSNHNATTGVQCTDACCRFTEKQDGQEFRDRIFHPQSKDSFLTEQNYGKKITSLNLMYYTDQMSMLLVNYLDFICF